MGFRPFLVVDASVRVECEGTRIFQLALEASLPAAISPLTFDFPPSRIESSRVASPRTSSIPEIYFPLSLSFSLARLAAAGTTAPANLFECRKPLACKSWSLPGRQCPCPGSATKVNLSISKVFDRCAHWPDNCAPPTAGLRCISGGSLAELQDSCHCFRVSLARFVAGPED